MLTIRMPFQDQNEIAVVARVVFRLIERDWRKERYPREEAPARIRLLQKRLGIDLGWRVGLTLAAYAWHIQHGYTAKFVRTTIVERAMMGCTFRAALLWSYKANRRK